jgi:hypothetical protein
MIVDMVEMFKNLIEHILINVNFYLFICKVHGLAWPAIPLDERYPNSVPGLDMRRAGETAFNYMQYAVRHLRHGSSKLDPTLIVSRWHFCTQI